MVYSIILSRMFVAGKLNLNSNSNSLAEMNRGGSQSSASNSPIDRLLSRVNYERKSAASQSDAFRLDTIRTILDRLGNPHHHLNIVHIAGTKGKGSTAHYVSQIGSAAGLKTGIYSSPHFERYTERFQIANQEVSENQLSPVLSEVLSIAEELDHEIENGSQSLKPATFFDISTTAAFLLFAKHDVELVALEVGLGGRLDSTNVCAPLVSIITNISLDHTRQLGNTTTKIAAEKAGIIKKNVPVICGPVEADVKSVIEKVAETQSAPLKCYGTDFEIKTLPNDNPGFGSSFDFLDSSSGETIQNIHVGEIGEHQCINASLAIAAMSEVKNKLHHYSESDWSENFRAGVSRTKLKGRLETVSTQPLVVADMAHNEASIKAMIAILQQLPCEGKKQALFSCSQDKDSMAMLRELSRFFDRLILTEFQSNPRSCPLDQLEQDLQSLVENNVENLSIKSISIPGPMDAWQRAMDNSSEYEMTVVCGSIFLVGELQEAFRKLNLKDDPNSQPG